MKVPCPCGKSSDGFCIYTDHSWCYVCSKFFKNDNQFAAKEPKVKMNKEVQEYHRGIFSAIESRKLTKETCEKYGIKVIANDKGITKHIYPYYDPKGNLTATKIRLTPKQGFPWEGEKKPATLFGQQLFPQGGKTITLTEGELDAASVYQMNGGFPAVSISDGAPSAVACVKKNFEYLNSFQKIVICFDSDDEGKKAAKEVADLLGRKAHIMDCIGGKDASDYLQHGRKTEFLEHWWRAKQYTPDDIVAGDTLWETVSKEAEYVTVPYPWERLQKVTYGMRDHEMVVVTANPKVGKSSFLKELIFHLLSTTDANLGLLMLEEPIRHTSLDLMGMTLNRRLRIPGNEVSQDVLKDAFDKTVGSGRVYFFNHFGSTEVENIIRRITYLAKVQNCKYIILDHVSIVVSDQNGDERKMLDEIATKLKKLTMELGICLFVIVHTNRQGTIRGTAAFEQLGNIVMKLTRDSLDPDPIERNTLRVILEYNRFSGDTGPGCDLRYDPTTGRLTEILPPEPEEEDNKVDNQQRQEEPTPNGADR